MTDPNTVTIAVDAMGGDHGPEEIIPACLQIVHDFPNIKIIAVGDQDILQTILSNHINPNIKVVHANEIITMDEPFINALRKRHSSMRIALELVKNKEAHACVSAGNTGALIAIARYVLKTLPGIDRPAILCPLPNKHGVVHTLDLGANIECSAEHLVQFAIMGASLISATTEKSYPSVALLNIGSEIIKGTDAIRLAFDMLTKHKDINFIGFIEGHDIYTGNIDVIVCDGFVGNVTLKASEGLADLLLNALKQEFSSTMYRKILSLFALPILNNLKKKFDPDKHNGASLLGLQGIVIKSHGNAKKTAFTTAIKTAIHEALKDIPGRIANAVSEKLVSAEEI